MTNWARSMRPARSFSASSVPTTAFSCAASSSALPPQFRGLCQSTARPALWCRSVLPLRRSGRHQRVNIHLVHRLQAHLLRGHLSVKTPQARHLAINPPLRRAMRVSACAPKERNGLRRQGTDQLVVQLLRARRECLFVGVDASVGAGRQSVPLSRTIPRTVSVRGSRLGLGQLGIQLGQ
jgi:hypothetical protein